MRWVIIDNPNQHFITSDNPVTRIEPREFHHPFYGDGGFLNEKCFVDIPISSNRVLEMHWSDRIDGNLFTIDKQRARKYNQARAVFAERYLYSSRRDSGIAALARKYSKPGFRMKLENAGKQSPINVVRKLR